MPRRKRVKGWYFIIKKSDEVRVHHERRSDGVRVGL